MFKQVLKPSESEGMVLNYTPKAFSASVPEQVKPFAKSPDQEGHQRDFEINSLVAQSTGLSDLERKTYQARLESEVLLRLKDVEEKAHAEAYQLGLQEGHQKAFDETKASIEDGLRSLASIAQELTVIKERLVVENEAGMVETVFHLAKTLAFKEIQGDPAVISGVLVKALENAQHDEKIILRINPRDAQFLETVKGQAGNPLERINRLRVETEDGITHGGCVLETNYGVIDATIEQRVQKLWKTLEEKIPTPRGEK